MSPSRATACLLLALALPCEASADAPPTGTPIRIFGGAGLGTTASPVTTGEDATATVTFDDSVRMP